MTVGRGLFWAIAAIGVGALVGLFLLYRNPLFEIYLTTWGLC
jgi:hypothetical protein